MQRKEHVYVYISILLSSSISVSVSIPIYDSVSEAEDTMSGFLEIVSGR